MRKIIKLSGVTVDNDTLPRIVVSEEERAIASMPELIFWMQAGAAYARGDSFIDRASGELIVPLAETNRWVQEEFPNGAPALQAEPNTASSPYLPTGGAQLDPNRWSVVAVANAEYSGSGVNNLVSSATSLGSGEIGVRIAWATNGRLYAYGAGASDVRLSSAGIDWGSTLTVMMCTFSVERGLKFFMDGEEVASNPDDRRPLDNTTFQLSAGPGITSAAPTGFRGKLGHLMVFNTDLSAPENRGVRLGLNEILMAHYEIA